MTTEAPEATTLPFKAEVQQVLQILAHSLYTDREIFLRELISNASDALHRAQFELLTNREALDADAELAVRISVDEEAKTITVSDTGIGMTRDEVVENLGTIAQSGARALIQSLEASKRGDIIGQFGVGFYSVFMVADRVTVTSRSIRPEAEATVWESTGGNSFTVNAAEKEARGTDIVLHLKADAHEFASDWRLEQVIKRHSEFVAFPVYAGDRKVTQSTAIWRKQPREVKPEDYDEFYRQLTYDFEKPLHHLHLSTDAPLDLHAILFVPSKRERGLMQQRNEGKVKLYSRKVLIQEEAKELLPSYFRFVEGVVDSEDLPLNVSRETVQGSAVMQKLKKTLGGRLHKDLRDMAEKQPEQYATFWKEFGPFIKEGVAGEANDRDDLLKLLRFHSTKSEGDALITLAEYKGRMAEGQDEIYYLLASDIAAARHSPHLDALESRGLEVLLLVDMMDGFMLNGLREYEGKKLRNIDDADLKLPGEDEAKPEGSLDDEALAPLIEKAQAVLGERVTGVTASDTLRGSPVRLAAPESSYGREMERINRMLGRETSTPKRVLELNRAHPLVASLARAAAERPDDALLALLVEQLYDSALLLEGLHPNPADMVPRIQQILEAAAAKG
ncbi:MAG: molecular chaperone HtpG [Chloroflexales bacterium]|nr:molecular chaperone HtpG [Chloroflexales bacterium]